MKDLVFIILDYLDYCDGEPEDCNYIGYLLTGSIIYKGYCDY